MAKTVFKIIPAVLCLFLVLGMTACTRSQNPNVAWKKQEIAAPLEPVNRFIFGFNNILDKILIDPIAKGYNAILPSFVRNSIQNFMHNLKSPLIIANNLLQGDVGDAGTATARFVINSTVGVAGLIDVAKTQGLYHEDEDFGQTLATWGFGDGFYLVLPVLGPSSLRDTVGIAADSFADPVRIIAFDTDHEWVYYTRNALEGLDNRARMSKAIDDLRRNSLDYYASVRSTYSQKRITLIHDGKSRATSQVLDYNSFQ